VQEDAVKFLKHSAKKEFIYDGILADPPSWGHGAASEVWTFEEQISDFKELCFKTLHKNSFFLLSTHTHGVQHEALRNLLGKEAIAGEISVAHKNDSRLLPAGIYALKFK
jgi:23S rRNA (cytosine1962-C5)-methyltransferase